MRPIPTILFSTSLTASQFLQRAGFNLLASAAVLVGLSGAADAGFVDLKFSQYQVADSQWNTGNCTTTSTCEIYSKVPGTAYEIPWTNGQVDWGVDRYMAFILNTGADAETNPLIMALYEADGTLVRTLGTGRVLTAGVASDGNSYFFFIGNDNNTGQLFSGSFGMDSEAGLTFTGTRNPSLEDLDTFSTGLATTPLARGQVFSLNGGNDPDTDPEQGPGDPTAERPQSVLERVLASIDGATNLARVNGTFVNIAENIGGVNGEGINGSITNIVNGVTLSTQSIVSGGVAVEYGTVTLSFGDMATTALGAVNTGEITLGVNAKSDAAKTRSTEAMSAAVGQLGGSQDTGVLVLNIASNMTGINGAITNTMTQVNGTVGDLSTTALGAVNTGTIVSGVNAAVAGIVGQGS